jgi:hypothetical protein
MILAVEIRIRIRPTVFATVPEPDLFYYTSVYLIFLRNTLAGGPAAGGLGFTRLPLPRKPPEVP